MLLSKHGKRPLSLSNYQQRPGRALKFSVPATRSLSAGLLKVSPENFQQQRLGSANPGLSPAAQMLWQSALEALLLH